MSKIIKFERDDQLLEFVEKANKALKVVGVRLDELEVHDFSGSPEESALYELTVDEENQLNQIRELVRKAPLGYYQGRLIMHRSIGEQDVVNWLVKLHKLLGL